MVLQPAGPFQDAHQCHFCTENSFMQVYLPVHQPPGHQKLFNGINPFFFHHQFSVMHGKHFEDPVVADHTFTYAR